MTNAKQRMSVLLGAALLIAVGREAIAADISGAWADNASMCSQIFQRSGDRTSFTRDSDQYGSGLIIEGGTIRGRTATCKITRRKQEGSTLHLITSCATDTMLDTVQFTVRIIDDNKFSRLFPGVPELEFTYERCR